MANIELRHGDRVLVGGWNGRPGTVMKCAYKPPKTGHYFKVRLDAGEWVWPDNLVCESRGQYELRCSECNAPFKNDNLGEVLCPNCDRFGSEQPGAESRQAAKRQTAWDLGRHRLTGGRR